MIPGEVVAGSGEMELNPGRARLTLLVENTGDRPIQVGSHFHFADANAALAFDRDAAHGFRLDVPAGTGVRFEPGISRQVTLVALAGRAEVPGLQLRPAPAGTTSSEAAPGPAASPEPEAAPGPAASPEPGPTPMVTAVTSARLERRRYAELYGPTVGDRVRLGDTDLWISPTEDRCAPCSPATGRAAAGDEAVFGGGKVIRESMGQALRGTVDLVITNVVILDHWGVVKADVGIRHGRIAAIGKAGNPDVMDGVHPDLVIGPGTEVLAGEGRILTAGIVDCHVHLICPQVLDMALAAGTTTIIGGGTGPPEGTRATTVTPGAWNLARMLEALDRWPVNVALLGKGNTVDHESLLAQGRTGAAGFKLHEDWGSTPAAIDACLRAADELGVQVAIHTDTLNEAGFVADTLAAIAGRSIHAYHTEGAGGGHAPDIITVAAAANVLPSSTNPTRPHTVNTIDEHLDMLMVCHHLNPRVAEDLAFAESRIRPTTIAAEDVLHDLGAISIIGSDSQAMGRVGEVSLRTWQTAHVMKARVGPLPDEPVPGADNLRARRYVAKITICPAVAHGLEGEVGSVEVGKLADLALWDPQWFGIRPEVVLKGGLAARAQMGDANASIPTPQPRRSRPMFGDAIGGALSVAWVAPAALEDGLGDRLRITRPLVPVADTRSRGKADLPENTATPAIEVDPSTFAVHIDGEVVEPAPVSVLPLAQRYSLF